VRSLEASGAPLTLLGAGLVAAALQRVYPRFGGGATRVLDLCVGDAVSDSARATVTEGIASASAAAAGGARLHVAIRRLRIGADAEVSAYPYRRDDGSVVRMYEAPITSRARADAPRAAKPIPSLLPVSDPAPIRDARAVGAGRARGGGGRSGRGASQGGEGVGPSGIASAGGLAAAAAAAGADGALADALRSLFAKVSTLEVRVESLQGERNADRQRSKALELRVQVRRALARVARSLSRAPVQSLARSLSLVLTDHAVSPSARAVLSRSLKQPQRAESAITRSRCASASSAS
jgi:hypothetical protein